MHTGLVIYGSLDTISGGYLYDRKLVEYLRARGDEVMIITLPWRNYLSHLGDNFSSKLLDHLEQLQLDVLLEDELNHPSLFLINKRLRNKVNYPIVAVVHHLRSSEQHPKWVMWLYRWIERHYLSSLDGIIYNSEATKDSVENLLNRTCNSVVAYPAGNHLQPEMLEEQIIERTRGKGPLHVLFLGNVIPRKGLHTLIAALKLLPVDSFHLSVIGRLDLDASYVQRLQKSVTDWGVGNRVIFHGSLDQNRVIQIMKDSHVLAVPSTYEGFGIVYLEGMGFGLPVIASQKGGAREIVSDGQDGFLIDPGDANEVARSLRKLYQDRETLCRMSLAARQRFRNHPGWEQSGEIIRQFLLSIKRGSDANV